jgi:hypothetical protein
MACAAAVVCCWVLRPMHAPPSRHRYYTIKRGDSEFIFSVDTETGQANNITPLPFTP